METSRLLKYCLLSLLFTKNFSSFAKTLDGNGNVDVQTNYGPIQGSEFAFRGYRLHQFLGIPYAQPPVDNLRFKKPQPPQPWTETLVAKTIPPTCIQHAEYLIPIYDYKFQAVKTKSEDCLYLNIWIPHGEKKVPVMFWIFGGAFEVGSINVQWYKGKALAAVGQVAVVTINYRMSAFGFLDSGTDDAPGNVGIYDMVEALKWVKSNIEYFGGDPNQITIFGQGSGSQSIGLLCVSPLTKGMFQRVIMQSGSPAYLLAEDNTANKHRSQKLAMAAGCANSNKTIYNDPGGVVSCLRKMNATKLIEMFYPADKPISNIFYPNYGDDILPMNARISLINGKFHDVEVLIGETKDPGSIWLVLSDIDRFGKLGQKDPQIDKSLGEKLLRENFKGFTDVDAVIQHYLGPLASNDYDQIRHNVYTAIGDYIFLCPAEYFAESYSKANKKVYFYFFTHRSTDTPWVKWTGVSHYADVLHVFGDPYRNPDHFTKQETKLSLKIMKSWSNFAKYGKPQSHILEKPWPQYSRQNPIFMELNTLPGMQYGKGPNKKNCDFFRNYFGFK